LNALVQRVLSARVDVEGEAVGLIGKGLLVFVGVMDTDTPEIARALASRILKFRIFEDDASRMNRSILDVGGEILLVSQFTLCADLRKGNRPSFAPAAEPERAENLLRVVSDELSAGGCIPEHGRFRANMEVHLVNDGPATFYLTEPRVPE
jgi:D-tyrosyl-tRNA(Tyr) deacylase